MYLIYSFTSQRSIFALFFCFVFLSEKRPTLLELCSHISFYKSNGFIKCCKKEFVPFVVNRNMDRVKKLEC